MSSANNTKIGSFISLHLLLVLYSLTDLFGKAAAGFSFTDARFFLCYGGVLLVLFVYAIGWQQLIKRLPLTTAFANKAITVFWGLVWGVLFFQEELTPLKVIGAGIVVAGVVLFSRADNEERRNFERAQNVNHSDAEQQAEEISVGTQQPAVPGREECGRAVR
ncbi:MAG: DMT family transporter [Gordonibacter sp.]|nr:DMT family transporter [Gordonibacter sp.]